VGVPQGSPLSAILAEMAMAEVRSRIAASVDGAVVVSHGDNLLALSPPGIQIAAFQMVLLDAVRCVLREGAVLEEHRKLWHGPPAGPFNYIGYEIRLEDGRHVTISSSARRWENIEERLLANIQDNPERWNRERVVSLAASHLARYRGDPYSTRRGLQLVAKGAVWVNDHPKKPAPIPDKCDRRRIYTDGAWDPSTRAGAWACVWRDQAGVWQQLTGTATWTTSNQMELRAVIEAGRLFENATALEIISDSTYVVTSVELHLARWRTSKWRKARGGRVRNTLLWRALVTELSFHDIAFTWTPGHAGNPGNERADAAAKSALKALVEGNPVAPPAIQTLR
jgi:ribonuclease HI